MGSNGGGKLAIYIALGVAFLTLMGAVYSIGTKASSIESKLDRNCRVLIQVRADVDYVILVLSPTGPAKGLRRIFGGTAPELCG